MTNQSLVETFNRSKKLYGPWVARSDALHVLNKNLNHTPVYRRDSIHPDTTRQWQKVHDYGHHVRNVLKSRDAQEIIKLINEGHGELAYYMTTKSKTALRDALLGVKGEDGQRLVVTCPCCSSYVVASEMVDGYAGQRFCSECVSNGTARYSDLMGCYYNRYDSVRCYSNQEDVEENTPENASAQWCRDHGYRRVNGEYYADGVRNWNSTELERIFGYHDGPDLGHIPSAYDNRKPRVLLGMELEVENNTGSGDDEDDYEIDRNDIARSILRKLNGVQAGFVKAENDGSLDNGFELITGYTGLDVHEKVWSQFKDARHFDHITSHDTETCGLHVHIDKAGMTALHAAKLATFIHSADNRRLMTCIARRYQCGDSGYAKFNNRRDWMAHAGEVIGQRHKEHVAYYGKHQKFNLMAYLGSQFCNERYSALNFHNDHTVEFRMFRGTTKFETIMACLEFTFASWHFTKHTSMKHLTTADFMAWICKAENRKDTKYLRKYLKAKKFRQFFQAERIAVPKFKDAEPSQSAEDRALYDDATILAA